MQHQCQRQTQAYSERIEKIFQVNEVQKQARVSTLTSYEADFKLKLEDTKKVTLH
jgi:hypothetical protein